jgi:2-polyprenyl-6-methoxyphenol hydroxylase-like FAD-dependent oxidoreductase
MNDRFDCAIIGAGPAGSVAAASAAEAGHKTLLIERDREPRVGPAQRLDGEARRKAIGLGVAAARRRWTLFRDELVSRLWKAAEGHGASLLCDCRAERVLFAGDQAVGVRLEMPSGASQEFLASHVIDASGQAGLLATQLGLRQPGPEPRQTIIWGIYAGVHSRLELTAQNIQVDSSAAWFCITYLSGNRICLALVGDTDYLLSGRGTPEEIFEDELVRCPGVARQLMSARLVSRFLVASHEPFTVRRSSGDGWQIIGDARQPACPREPTGFALPILEGLRAAQSLRLPSQGYLPTRRLSVPAFGPAC